MIRRLTLLAAIAATTALAFTPAAASNADDLLKNHSFELPLLYRGGWTSFENTEHGWDYHGSAVLINADNPAAGGSDWWLSAPCPGGYVGSQFLGLQEEDTASQTFTVPTSGDYVLKWLAAGRPVSNGGASDGDETYEIEIDGVVVGKTYRTHSSEPFTLRHLDLEGLSAGAHTVTFQGLKIPDETAFIDDVKIVPR